MAKIVNAPEPALPHLRQAALNCRIAILEALFASGGGHYGGALSVVDILVALYGTLLPTPDDWTQRKDRIILSKGHAAVALYAVLAHFGRLDASRLRRYAALDAGLEGHPDMATNRDVDFSTGSLGQGLGAGIGMALARRAQDVWVVLGDGECQEGSVWEAAMVAARYGVRNLHAIIDYNCAQEVGFPPSAEGGTAPIPQAAAKFAAFGWNVIELAGNDVEALCRTIRAVKAARHGPTAIVASTRKGAGVSRFEAEPETYHCATLSEAEHAEALEELTCKRLS